jgi:DNA (cytosine-5)-methyltransferase 1
MQSPQFLLPLADELIVDLFAGGGGASTGIEQAVGRHVDVAVNHDPDAVGLHQRNHPQTLHLVSDVFVELEADPNGGDPIPLAEPRCGDLRRAAERCITAWTVVRGGVWDPNGLMDEHMAALRKALGPND